MRSKQQPKMAVSRSLFYYKDYLLAALASIIILLGTAKGRLHI